MQHSFYDNMASTEIVRVYALIRILRRLRVIGVIDVNTTRGSDSNIDNWPYDPYNSKQLYRINKVRYVNDKTLIDIEEELETLFQRMIYVI